MITPKTISQVIKTVKEDGDFSPKAVIAKVVSSTKFEERSGDYGDYQQQTVKLEGSDGTKMQFWNKNEDVDYRDLEGKIVIFTNPPFKTKNPQVKAVQKGDFVNLNIGTMAAVWDVADQEIVNQADGFEKAKWDFDLPAGAKKSRRVEEDDEDERPVKKSPASAAVNSKADYAKQSFAIEPMSRFAKKYAEALDFAVEIVNGIEIPKGASIELNAVAAAILMGYTKQSGYSLDLEVGEEEEGEEETVEEEEEEKPVRKSRKKVVEPEPEDEEDDENEDEDEDEEEEEEPVKKVRSRNPIAASKAVSQNASGKASKSTSTTATKKSAVSSGSKKRSR